MFSRWREVASPLRLWVTNRRDDYIDLISDVRQEAGDLMQRASRQLRAISRWPVGLTPTLLVLQYVAFYSIQDSKSDGFTLDA
jgi:hypothetical protein